MPPPAALRLPYPPSVNGYWRCYRSRAIMSARGRKYRKDALAAIAEQNAPKFGSARVQVELTLHAPDKRKRDIDNYCKGVLDAVTHAGLWDDDEQIDELTIRRGDNRKGGEVVVFIREVG